MSQMAGQDSGGGEDLDEFVEYFAFHTSRDPKLCTTV